MKKIINIILSLLKYVLLIAAFALTLFIILKMNMRLNKSLADSVFIFVPYGILLLLFILNGFLNKKAITENLFYNLTSVLVFCTNVVVGLRAIFDTNMLYNAIQKMGVNFNYFNDYLAFNRIMLYGLIIANIVFMFIPNDVENEKVIASPAKKITKKVENNKK